MMRTTNAASARNARKDMWQQRYRKTNVFTTTSHVQAPNRTEKYNWELRREMWTCFKIKERVCYLIWLSLQSKPNTSEVHVCSGYQSKTEAASRVGKSFQPEQLSDYSLGSYLFYFFPPSFQSSWHHNRRHTGICDLAMHEYKIAFGGSTSFKTHHLLHWG